jgi:hypothetical protein
MRKLKIMKKIVLFMFMAALFLFQACYDDYKEDFDYSVTYFPRQFPLRTLVDVEGEDMTFELGAVLGGKYTNDVNEELSFVLQDTFLNADNYPQFTKLPDNYYTFESQDITIPSGLFKGSTTVTLDKDLFLNDPLAVGQNYALPVEITTATTDSILDGKHYSVIVVRYFNQYQGWYYVKGTDTNTNDNTFVTYSENDLVLNEDMLLETLSKDMLSVPYVGNPIVNDRGMQFTINSGSVTVSDGTGVTNVSGTGTYDSSTRNFTIEYNYTDGNAAIHAVTEELIYRNTELVLEEW